MSGGGSPKQGRCASPLAHRPCLGEILPLELKIGPFSAQDPALGENCPSEPRRSPTFPQVDGSALLAFSPKSGSCAPVSLPSRDVAPKTSVSASRTRSTLPSRDVAQDKRPIVPPWEGLVAWVSRRFSKAEALRRTGAASSRLGRDGLARAGEVLPSKDVAPHPCRIVPAWESSGLVGARIGSYLHNVPPWERTALPGREGLRRSRR